MCEIWALVNRHIKRFIRDKTAVFFSFLSVIILLALYLLFIGRQYKVDMGSLNDESLNNFLVMGVMMGGVLVINTMSLSLGSMGNLIEDLNNQTLDAFLVTPTKRFKIIVSYYLSSNIITSTLSIFMWVATILISGIFQSNWYTFDVIIKVIGLLVFYTFISSSIMLFITTLLKSVNAFGVLSGVLGTVIGFMSGIYMPLNILGENVKKFATLVPFTHMAIVLKSVLLEAPMSQLETYIPNPEDMYSIKDSYGMVELGILGHEVSMIWIFSGIIIFVIFMLIFAYRNMIKKIIR